MIRETLTLSALIAAVLLVRAVFKDRVPKRMIYALWLVVLLKLCMPGTLFSLPVLPAEQTAAPVQRAEFPAQTAPVTQPPAQAVQPQTPAQPVTQEPANPCLLYTSIIKILTAELRPTSGSALVNGFAVEKLRGRAVPYLRRTLGVIFQDFRLISDKSVYENVAFAMRVIGAPEKEIQKRVPYVLELVGLETKGRRLPNELSGGEQQRVAIARALVNNPSVIIADEPTGNLDPARSLEIMMLLEQINALGTTVLVVTHERELVNRFTKRVVAISEGCLLYTSSASTIFSSFVCPSGRSPRVSRPSASRRRYVTGRPRLASIRRTWWYFPSCTSTTERPGPSGVSFAGRQCRPSARTRPASKARTSAGPAVPSCSA